MKLKHALIALGALAALSGPAAADGYITGPREIAVPAPMPVPAPIPVQEGFTCYFRADINYGWPGSRSYSEKGLLYGEDPGGTVFTSAAMPFSSDVSDVYGGTFGIGAYFTPRIRGDITLDWRHDQTNKFSGSYPYAYGPIAGDTVNGRVLDSLKLSSAVVLANGYFEPLPRGMFTPYVGAGIGFVYNQITRSYSNTETLADGAGVPANFTGTTASTRSRVGAGKDSNVGLAAALMAGVSFSLDHRWALDVGYRALYMDGMSSTITVPSFVTTTTQHSTATLDSSWEHEVRVGLRFNIW
jgi:opacity protein-like surface antigen